MKAQRDRTEVVYLSSSFSQATVPAVSDPLAALRQLDETARGCGKHWAEAKGGAEVKELDADGQRLLKSYTAGALFSLSAFPVVSVPGSVECGHGHGPAGCGCAFEVRSST